MSSIMDIMSEPKGGITLNWLRTHGFKKRRWGSPAAREHEGSVFYEMDIYVSDSNSISPDSLTYRGSVMYFPETFDGYTYFGSSCYGHGVVTKKIVLDVYWSTWSTRKLILNCETKSEFNDAMFVLRRELAQYGEVLVTDKKLIKEYEKSLQS
jgi:hypothetical protein